MAQVSHDDGFREIQLNGKQLVFLFMSATVVSVVIFLCGVMVGQGLRPAGGEATTTSAEAAALGTPAVDLGLAPTAAAGPPTTDTPVPTPDELSYYERLERDVPPVETLRAPALALPEPIPRVDPLDDGLPATRAAAAEPAAAPSASPMPVATSDPRGPGYAVQVAALQARREADSIAARLSDKGYPAYVMAPGDGAPASIYRVRVGKFQSRREAEQVAARLEKEEQFKPWIIR